MRQSPLSREPGYRKVSIKYKPILSIENPTNDDYEEAQKENRESQINWNSPE